MKTYLIRKRVCHLTLQKWIQYDSRHGNQYQTWISHLILELKKPDYWFRCPIWLWLLQNNIRLLSQTITNYFISFLLKWADATLQLIIFIGRLILNEIIFWCFCFYIHDTFYLLELFIALTQKASCIYK